MTPADLPDDLITPRQAARLLRCHIATLHRWIQTGKLPAWRRGGERYLVSESAVLALVEPVAVAAAPVVGKRATTARQRQTRELMQRLGIA